MAKEEPRKSGEGNGGWLDWDVPEDHQFLKQIRRPPTKDGGKEMVYTVDDLRVGQ